MESVRDKVVLITGASSGIGASTAVQFAKYGAKIALTGRNTTNLQKVAEECTQSGQSAENILLISADLTKNEDIQRIVEETIGKFQRLDVLVNNAGMAMRRTFEDVTEEEIEQIFSVNVKSVILLTKCSLPYLKSSKGCIVNVSSVLGYKPAIYMTSYCMTKAAMDMFTSTLALELGPSGVRVNSVNPGIVKTNFHGDLGSNAEKFYEARGKLYPLGRVAEAEEVANAIIYLASDAAVMVNGVKLPVDGGISNTSSWYQDEDQLQEQKKKTRTSANGGN